MDTPEKPRYYSFGDYELDIEQQTLHCCSGKRHTVTLTRRVSDTLLYLVEHPGELVGKDTLMKAVWPRVIVEENNLDQSISTLRHLLGEQRGQHRYIVTVRGRGYRFAAPVTVGSTPRRMSETDAPRERETLQPAFAAPARAHTTSARSNRKRMALGVAAAATFILAIGIQGYVLLPSNDAAPAAAAATLAVLPFKPLTPTDRNASLELGMAETLIAGLNDENLRVSPLSSVRRYADLEQDAVRAGLELGVDAVLEGHMQRDGARLRVSTRLLNVADGRQLWAERYDERFTDIFSVQDAIAARVRAALAPESVVTLPAPLRRYTSDAEAYQLYVNGRFHMSRLSDHSLRQAIGHFQQAVQRDPEFALAYVGMSDVYSVLGVFGIAPPHEVFPEALRAAEKALVLQPDLGEAYAALGHIKVQYDHDWDGARWALLRAVELNPHYAFARQLLGLQQALAGRFEEGIGSLRDAQALEPSSPGSSALIGMILNYDRRYDEAIEQLQKTLEMEPRLGTAHTYLAAAYVRLGKYDQAMHHLAQVQSSTPGSRGYVGQIHALSGRHAAALEELASLAALSRDGFAVSYEIASIYAALGDLDETFAWLDRAFEDRSTMIGWLPWDEAFDGIRSDPRYVPLVRRLPPL